MDKDNDSNDKEQESTEFLETCEECGETAVFVNGKCRTCYNCGNSLCSL